MDERRDRPPPPGSRPRLIPSIAGRLSPVQQAWSDYVRHGLSCGRCRSLDGGRCDESAQLHGIYQAADKAAHERLFGETP